ncbi:YgiT-type zinc finger protein [Candidatus Woesearchaeota archaeon]|nr:YgiT-type zinc finger protein [Candidatus Woesearchaeota archaeon]
MKEKDACWECGVKMINKKVDYSLYGIRIGKFPAFVCQKCGETYFSEETSKKMTEITKKEGLWGLGAKTKIGQAGSTLDIRLNKRIIDFMQLKRGGEVNIYPESKNKLIIEV